MTIRWATQRDADGLWALNRAFNGDGISTRAQIADSLEHNPCERIAVCDSGGALTGFLCVQVLWSMCYRARVAQLTELYVDPAHRRQGIALALMRFVEQALQAEGIDEFWLLTGRENAQAQALYERLGYARTDEVQYGKHYEG